MLHPTKPELPSRNSTFEETSHRHSQVVPAQRYRHDEEEDSNQSLPAILAQELSSVTRGTRQSPPKTVVEQSQEDWFDLARVAGILPLAPDNSPWLHTSNLPFEQQTESLSRDLRLAQLERRQRLLSIIFGTLLVGTAVVCTLIVRHQAERHEGTIAQLQKPQTERQLVQVQKNVQPISRDAALDARITTPAKASKTPSRIEIPTLVITSTAQTTKTQAPPTARSTTKEAPELTAGNEPTELTATKDAPELTPSKGALEPADSADSAESPVPADSKDAPTTPTLREAIKSAVSKEASQPTKSAESHPTARLACDKNDPLCGDLS